jgi:hypothetical protein
MFVTNRERAALRIRPPVGTPVLRRHEHWPSPPTWLAAVLFRGPWHGRLLPMARTVAARLGLAHAAPDPPPRSPAPGPRRARRQPRVAGAGYCLVKLHLTALTAYLTVLAVVGGLYCLTCPAWWLVNPAGSGLLDPGGWGGSWYVAARPGFRLGGCAHGVVAFVVDG